jgi:hypothetical protein
MEGVNIDIVDIFYVMTDDILYVMYDIFDIL